MKNLPVAQRMTMLSTKESKASAPNPCNRLAPASCRHHHAASDSITDAAVIARQTPVGQSQILLNVYKHEVRNVGYAPSHSPLPFLTAFLSRSLGACLKFEDLSPLPLFQWQFQSPPYMSSTLYAPRSVGLCSCKRIQQC